MAVATNAKWQTALPSANHSDLPEQPPMAANLTFRKLVGFGCMSLLMQSIPLPANAADRENMLFDCTGPYSHPSCRNNRELKDDSPSNNNEDQSGEDILGPLIGEVLRQHLEAEALRKQQLQNALRIGSNLVDTGGEWYVIGLGFEGYANVFSDPNRATRLAQVPRDATGITLAGKCINSACPIKLNSSENYGIGWIYGYYISNK